MSNYFEYQDFAKVDKSQMGLNTNRDLQTNSDIEQLRYGVRSYDFASFEKDAYVTAKPKILAKSTDDLGLVSYEVSDNEGNIDANVTITLSDTYSLSGITIYYMNAPKVVSLYYYDVNGAIIGGNYRAFYDLPEKTFFLNYAEEGVKKIRIVIGSTKEPYHFATISRIEFGAVRTFDSSNLIEATVDSHYSVDGSTIEYDVLKASVFHTENTEYMFTKKQPVVYKTEDGKVIQNFYIETSEKNNDYVINFTAYDNISNLESTFLGGKYGFGNSNGYSLITLIDDILSDTGVEYSTLGLEDISVTGFIPICTKRKALTMICRGCNIRCFKIGGTLVFKPFHSANTVEYTDKEIIENPLIKSSQTIGSLTAVKHNYSGSNETQELYHWYLQQGDETNQIVIFSQPVWKVVPYEVERTDEETGEDIISDTVSPNITFLEQPTKTNTICNYVKIGRQKTENKVVLVGYKIEDHSTDYVINREFKDVNAEYDNIVIDDITITSGIEDVANYLFLIENERIKQTISVVDVDRPNIGDNIVTSLVDTNRAIKISSVTDDLSGVYKVVAE